MLLVKNNIYDGNKSLKLIKVTCPYCKRVFQAFKSQYTKFTKSPSKATFDTGEIIYYSNYKTFCIKCKQEFKFTIFVSD